MAETNMIKEYLQTGIATEGSLLIPKKIYDNIIMAVDKALIPRSEAALVLGPSEIPGSSIDIDLETPDSMGVRLVGEGAEFPIDVEEYTSFNLKPAKYGVQLRITKEMTEDSKFNLLSMNIMRAGKEMAENENSLIISNALDNATNTVSGGAAITIANITRAVQYLEDSDYQATTFFVGNEVLNDLRNIDTFVEANKVGNTDMIAKGFLGTIYGMNVIRVSTNAGMTTTSAYVTDKNQAYVIAEKRPVTVEGFKLNVFDMEGVVVSQRIVVRQLRASAIAKITTT
jgi:HK97 family phage major capsid protein